MKMSQANFLVMLITPMSSIAHVITIADAT